MFASTSNQPLTLDQVRAKAPSVFATEAHGSRSERYTYIPTSTVVEGLLAEGFQPYSASQGRSRVPGKAEFTKHLIRFRHPSAQMKQVGDTVPEIVLINSHDGTSSYVIAAGLFRLVCLNGMVVPDCLCGEVRVPHKGDIVSNVIDATWSVVDQAAEVTNVIQDWRQIELEKPEQVAFAEAAHSLRFDGASDTLREAISPAQLLAPRRFADQGNDLWAVFNRVQENVTKGGVHGVGRDANGRRRNVSTRPIKGIDQDVRLNKALMILGQRLAELKA